MEIGHILLPVLVHAHTVVAAVLVPVQDLRHVPVQDLQYLAAQFPSQDLAADKQNIKVKLVHDFRLGIFMIFKIVIIEIIFFTASNFVSKLRLKPPS